MSEDFVCGAVSALIVYHVGLLIGSLFFVGG